MSKKEVVIRYGGVRVLLSTVASYYPTLKQESGGGSARHGVRFLLRSGDSVTGSGSDEVARNNVLKFLDRHFSAQYHKSDKCSSCVHWVNSCNKPAGQVCSGYNNYRVFKRKKDEPRSMAETN